MRGVFRVDQWVLPRAVLGLQQQSILLDLIAASARAGVRFHRDF
jgi:hypothetical protein